MLPGRWRGRTLGVQELGQAQVLLGQVKGVLQVVVGVGLLQLVKVDQVWSARTTETEFTL